MSIDFLKLVLSGRDIRSAWRAAHAAVAGVPGWARLAAYAIPFTVLPSSLWRIAACTFHAPITEISTHVTSGIPGLSLGLFVVLLSLASEVAAFAGVGLVASWGEVVPRWVPGLGGRPVPPRAVVVAAGLGAVLLTLLSTWTAVHLALGQRIDGSAVTASVRLFSLHDWRGLLAVVTYAPLLLWGPLLAVVTVSYHRRRRGALPRGERSRGGAEPAPG